MSHGDNSGSTLPRRMHRFLATALLLMAVPALALLVTLVGYVNARRIPRGVTHVTVPIAGLPEPLHGFTIAQITDLHVGPTIKQAYVAGVVDRLNALHPGISLR